MPDLLTFDGRLQRAKFRAWHRGTREADYIVGGFFDKYATQWTEDEAAWFERLLEEQDVDIMGWAMGSIAVPDIWQGPMMDALKRLDFVRIA